MWPKSQCFISVLSTVRLLGEKKKKKKTLRKGDGIFKNKPCHTGRCQLLWNVCLFACLLEQNSQGIVRSIARYLDWPKSLRFCSWRAPVPPRARDAWPDTNPGTGGCSAELGFRCCFVPWLVVLGLFFFFSIIDIIKKNKLYNNTFLSCCCHLSIFSKNKGKKEIKKATL